MLVPLVPPPSPPMTNFLPHSKPTFWVSMAHGNELPTPHSPFPAYPRAPGYYSLQLAYYYILWSPGATLSNPDVEGSCPCCAGLSQGSQIPIGVKSHMLGLEPPPPHTHTLHTRQYQPIQRGFETGMPP